MTNQYSRHKCMNHPWLLALMTIGGVYIAKLWYDDYQATRRGETLPSTLPGTSSASTRSILIAITGALVLLALETLGERCLGIAEQQTRVTWLFALYSTVAAPAIEEIIFRGWLVLESRGRAWTWIVASAASVAFALLHPFLWSWDENGFELTLTRKAWFTTGMLFATSLWLYAARLARWNPTRSLLPCFAAHAARNAGAIALKAASGFVGPMW